MTDRKRLSICYVVPGHHLLPSAGPTRNVLSLAEALSQWADITVAFRSISEPITPGSYKVIALEQAPVKSLKRSDDAAIRGIGFSEFIAYLALVRRFVDERCHCYDIILEKSWMLSGYVVSLCQRRGLPGMVIENVVRIWNEPLRNTKEYMRYAWYRLTQALIGRYLRQTPLIIAETEELKTAMLQRWCLPSDRIAVVALGVDHNTFRPMDQLRARSDLGFSPDATILLYAGVLDQVHDLKPVIDAISNIPYRSTELHIVGDGVLRNHYDAMINQGQRRIFFHGRIPHERVPHFIAAADLCLAPYDLKMFPRGQVAYATLKIPEYMACARPVVSVPSGHIHALIQHGISGFLFHNNMENWRGFLDRCPEREELRRMGIAAVEQVRIYNWHSTARTYFDLCVKALSQKNESGSMSFREECGAIREDMSVGS